LNKPLTKEKAALQEAYHALNRNDFLGFMQIMDPDIERVEPTGFPQAGTYKGFEAVSAHVSKGRDTWAEGSCEPDSILIAGNRIIVSVFVRVRLKNETNWKEGRVTDVFTYKNGKAISFHTFTNSQEAFAFAGIKDPD
jgi:uncharacterized protein